MTRKRDLPNHRELDERRRRKEGVLKEASVLLEKSVHDAEVVAGVEDRLDMNGTAEASEAILTHIERARHTAEQTAERYDHEVDRTREDGEELARDIAERAADVESDAERVGDAERRVESSEIATEMRQAEQEACRIADDLNRLAADTRRWLAQAQDASRALRGRLNAARR